MKINIEYFARFKEKSGKSFELIETESSNLSFLYEELDKKYRFDFPKHLIKVALNEEFTDWNQQLKENDHVVFIQPVAGG